MNIFNQAIYELTEKIKVGEKINIENTNIYVITYKKSFTYSNSIN